MNCTNHAGRQAASFCFSCSKWFCQECIKQQDSQPICESCLKIFGNKSIVPKINLLNNDKLPLFFRIASVASSVVFILLSALITPYFFFFIISSVIGFSVSFLFKNKNKSVLNRKSSKITDAQVSALLNRYEYITIAKLAQATSSTEPAAKEKLNALVENNKIDISAGDLELHYSKKELLS